MRLSVILFLHSIVLIPYHHHWWVVSVVSAKRLPEPSSSLLQLQKLYLQQPPHDVALYDRLEVSPNATAREITQAYRRLCKRHHPDKAQTIIKSTTTTGTDPFDQLQKAYQVLKDDTTRLVYHRYGLVDSSQAVGILSGSIASLFYTRTSSSSKNNNHNYHDPENMAQLLRLMGYPPEMNYNDDHDHHDHSVKISRQERVWRIACQLLEQLRLVVEDQVSMQTFLDALIQECDTLKRLPLGAQIIRCIGRAYRHAGQKALGGSRKTTTTTPITTTTTAGGRSRVAAGSASTIAAAPGLLLPRIPMTARVREGFRDFKQLATALVATGRVLVAEKRLVDFENKQKKKQKQQKQQKQQKVEYYFDGELGELISTTTTTDKFQDDDHDDHDDDDTLSHHHSNLQHEQHIKTQSTLLESLQVEALWKVTKIELDKVVRQACELILQGDYFFVKSSTTTSSSTTTHLDGWVGYRSNQAVNVNVGRQRAAEALVLMGNVMVEQSKEGTSWLD